MNRTALVAVLFCTLTGTAIAGEPASIEDAQMPEPWRIEPLTMDELTHLQLHAADPLYTGGQYGRGFAEADLIDQR